MLDKAKSKVVVYIVSGGLSFLLFITPIIVAGGVIAVPIIAIHDFFTNIGDFVFGDGEDNEAITLIEEYLKSGAGKKLITDVYQPVIAEEKRYEVPLHFLVIPNLLAGIEEENVTKDLVRQQMQHLTSQDGTQKEVETYINDLRKNEPWMTRFGRVSSTTIVGYIHKFGNYLGQEDSLQTGNLKDIEFLYPLKTPAVVTSEFGGRNLGTVGGVNVNNHTGIDLAYSGGEVKTCGVPIYAAQSGTVTESDQTSKGKNYLIGAYGAKVTYKNVDVWYLHMRDPFPHAPGTEIKKGDFVGYIGSSGLSTACHLHLEIHVDGKPTNPRNFIDFDHPKIFSFDAPRSTKKEQNDG